MAGKVIKKSSISSGLKKHKGISSGTSLKKTASTPPSLKGSSKSPSKGQSKGVSPSLKTKEVKGKESKNSKSSKATQGSKKLLSSSSKASSSRGKVVSTSLKKAASRSGQNTIEKKSGVKVSSSKEAFVSASSKNSQTSSGVSKTSKTSKVSSVSSMSNVSKKLGASGLGENSGKKGVLKKAGFSSSQSPSSAVGKNRLKATAKALASAAQAKEQKQEEIKQKITLAKEKARLIKAKRDEELKEEQISVETKKKRNLVPEPFLSEKGASSSVSPEGALILTDAEGRPYCKVKDCDQIALVDGYCRYHYLLLWKRIQVRRKILMDGKLERYVEELTSRYPDKFLDVIRKDLLNEKNFQAVIAEMEIDDSGSDSDFDEEDTQSIEEVRSFSESSLIGDDDF
jgi:hypothetical protein